MDKNFLIAIILITFVILIFGSPQYQKRFGKSVPSEPVVESEQTSPLTTKEEKKPGEILTGLSSEPDIDSLGQTEKTVKVAQINIDAIENDFTLENNDIKIILSTRGGIIKKAIMKNFKGRSENELAQLVTEGEVWYGGKIIDDEIEINLSDIIFSGETNTGNHVLLQASLTGNRTISREFSLDDNGFILHASSNLGGEWYNPVLHFYWNGPVNDTEEPVKKINIWPFTMFMRDDTNYYNNTVYLGQGDRMTFNGNGKEKNTSIYTGDGSQKIDARKNNESGQDFFAGDLDWYAVRSKYFMTAAIPKDNKRWEATSEYSYSGNVKWYDFFISKRVSDGITDLDIYIGPISYDTLKYYDKNLTEIMELSWRFIRPISIAFLWLLKKLHAVIPNWGLVVIVFSIIIKVFLHPLSHKSFVSMRKMSSLQPQINELRDKHKNNPQKLHQATMELYKKEGVNPFGGCLPTLFQMPVFFALYPVIERTFELRQAMFIPHWIEDLSRPDPLYILPVAMGISMFLQSKQTMKDPNQKAMLYVMPVMMVIIFANFSSGLTLYWFLFNVMSYMEQTIHKP